MADERNGNSGRMAGSPVLGEVIEASTTRFVAQCPPERLHEPPALGAFVKIAPSRTTPAATGRLSEPEPEDPFADPPSSQNGFALYPSRRSDLSRLTDASEGTLYALVASATTGSTEPGRRPSAYGLDEATLRREQPQIFDLLATEFAALLVGTTENGMVHLGLPSRPPRLHALVTACSPEETVALTEGPDFARLILQAVCETPTDELLVASLRHACRSRNEDFSYLVRVGKQLALLLRDDPERLATLLRKLQPR